jgi:hypothetical protein
MSAYPLRWNSRFTIVLYDVLSDYSYFMTRHQRMMHALSSLELKVPAILRNNPEDGACFAYSGSKTSQDVAKTVKRFHDIRAAQKWVLWDVYCDNATGFAVHGNPYDTVIPDMDAWKKVEIVLSQAARDEATRNRVNYGIDKITRDVGLDVSVGQLELSYDHTSGKFTDPNERTLVFALYRFLGNLNTPAIKYGLHVPNSDDESTDEEEDY